MAGSPIICHFEQSFVHALILALDNTDCADDAVLASKSARQLD